MTTPASPPTAAPLDLDALTPDDWSRLDAVLRAVAEHPDYWHHGLLLERVRKVFLALVAAARRGGADTALREASGRAFDEIDINGASEDSARRARNILGPALTAYDRTARAHPEDTNAD